MQASGPAGSIAVRRERLRVHPVGKLLLLFIVVPLVELYLLLAIGSAVGFWPTVALVLVTGVLGSWLAKREGLRVIRQWQGALAQGQMPEEGVLGGLMVLVGGVFLITPGVLTDVAGLLLLFPPSRRVIGGWVRAYFERRIQDGSVRVVTFPGVRGVGGGGRGGPVQDLRRGGAGDVIDVEGAEVEEKRSSRPHLTG